MENDEVIDERTQQIIPKGADEKIPQRDLMITKVDANTIGTLELTPQAEEILSEEVKDEDIKIRPDGFLYLQWTWYADRLGRAFGKTGWGMIPQGAPQTLDQGNNVILVAWSFWLIAKGIPLSFAIGETSYNTKNKAMSFTDAAAGAKSIALARCCKELGMAPQLWDAVWIEGWKKEHAKYIDNPKQGGYPAKIWVLKNDPRYQTKSKVKAPVQSQAEPEKSVDEEFPKTQPEKKPESKPEMVPLADALAKKYSLAKIRTAPTFKIVKEHTGKENIDIVNYLLTLDQNKEYSIGQIIQGLKTSE